MGKKLLTGALLSLSLPITSYAAAPSVAVDIAPLHSLVSQVMQGVNKPDLIIPAEASPHHYTLRPSQAQSLSEADIVFWMGEEYTPWLEKALNNISGKALKVEILELPQAATYKYREGATFEEHAHHEEDEHHDEHDKDDHHDAHAKHEHHDEHDKDDHHDKHDEHNKDDHHHDHDGIDPHAWLDPENAKKWIEEIKHVLSKQDPKNAKKYEQNAKKAIAELDQLISDTKQKVRKLGDLKFVVFHDAYQYFEKRFDVSATGSISLGDAEDPSPKRISEIRNTVKKLGVNCVFTEPQYNPGLVHNVFEGSNVTAIGVMDPLGANLQPGNPLYKNLIKAMAKSLQQCNG